MRLFKIGQVFVVSDHSHRVACPLAIVLPLNEDMYYSKELLIKDVIVPFYNRKSFGEEGIEV